MDRPTPPVVHSLPCLRAPLCALLLAAGGLVAACANPLHNGTNDGPLVRSVRQSTDRELAEAKLNPEPVTLSREDRVSELRIDPRVMDELSGMAGPDSYKDFALPLGPSLFNKDQNKTPVTLQRAVLSTVKRNLNVEFARIAPAINQSQLAAAEAAFDWVFFGNTTVGHTHEPVTNQNFNGIVDDNHDTTDIGLGIRKPLISGGTLTIQTEYTRTLYRTNNLTVIPNPANTNNVVLQLDQPLLRNFGTIVSQAQISLARDTELDTIQQLKATLLQAITDAESDYWALVRAQSDLQIAQRLLDRGEEVLKVLRERKVYDAKPAVISNAAAAVESRRADRIRAQRALRAASDTLKQQMNDPEYPVGGTMLLMPADTAVDQPIQFNLLDAINIAFQNRPEIQRAILAMDQASIKQGVADNGRLPLLNLRALTRLSGLGDNSGGAYDTLSRADFVDYQVGVNFEQPIGNRAAEANYKVTRLQRMQTTIQFRAVVQQVVQDVKAALQDIQTNYLLIEQTRASRIAAAEDLRTLLIDEKTLQGLTPEFLNLKLTRQQAIATAEQQEMQALTDYNASLARFYQSVGKSIERNRIDFDVPNLVVDPKTSDLFPDWPSEKQREKDNPALKALP